MSHSDYTAYPVPAKSRTSRPCTPQELAIWMNKLADSVGSGVYHWVTEKQIHFMRYDVETKSIHEVGML